MIDYMKGTEKILKESQREKEKYFFEILGKKFIIYPGVFSPKYFSDTCFFAEKIPIRKGETFSLKMPSRPTAIYIASIRSG